MPTNKNAINFHLGLEIASIELSMECTYGEKPKFDIIEHLHAYSNTDID